MGWMPKYLDIVWVHISFNLLPLHKHPPTSQIKLTGTWIRKRFFWYPMKSHLLFVMQVVCIKSSHFPSTQQSTEQILHKRKCDWLIFSWQKGQSDMNIYMYGMVLDIERSSRHKYQNFIQLKCFLHSTFYRHLPLDLQGKTCLPIHASHW